MTTTASGPTRTSSVVGWTVLGQDATIGVTHPGRLWGDALHLQACRPDGFGPLLEAYLSRDKAVELRDKLTAALEDQP